MLSLDSASILKALTPVQVPELQKSLVELNMIRDITIKPSGIVGFTLVLNSNTTPAAKQTLIDQCKNIVKSLPEVSDVWVKVDMPTTQTPNPTPPTSNLVPVAGVKHIIAISSGKGGVGKTSVSVNVAVALAEMGAKVGILDADIYGPNVPLMLGMDSARMEVFKDATGKDIVQPAFNHGVKMISMAFLVEKDQPIVWRGPMLNGVIKQFLYQANWGELDYLIVDMPPGTGDAQLTLIQSVPLAGAVIVTTPQTVSLLDSRKGLKMFEQMGVSVLGIVENMSYFVPPDLPDRQYDIFGSGGGSKTAAELDLPLLGCIPLEIDLRKGSDRGIPIVLGQPESASAVALISIAKAIADKVKIS
jgi:ATP-binding protein involved in chromosome partitioning